MNESTKTRMSPSQQQFAELIEPFPRLSRFWNWQKCIVDAEALQNAMGAMSHGEQLMACFFLSVWLHKNQSFDFIEAAAVLDQSNRQIIVDWIQDPFWP